MKNLKNTHIINRLFILLILVLVGFGCAKIGTPSGGRKDVTPPKVVQSNPSRNTTHFHGKRIEITFDEFVQLNDVNKYFVASPPLKKMPMVLLRGKSISMSLEEPLKDSTTYRFYFGDAIADLNEKNVLKNFDFVVSTGDHIDSLSLRGRVLNAFTHKPDKESYYVMLYNHFQDSVPRKQLPQYVTKTDDKGWFAITNIKGGKYMIFALKDMNQNYRFDLPNEPIAFSDTLVNINKSYFLPDSLIKADTTSADTANRAPFKSQVQLYSFVEDNQKQFLKKSERNAPERFTISLNLPVDSLPMKPLNFSAKNWTLPDFPVHRKDSLVYWITDTSLIFKDTLSLQIAYNITDSLGKLKPRYDTISLINKRPPATRKKAPKPTISKFSVATDPNGTAPLDLNKKLILNASMPVANIDRRKIQLFRLDEKKKTPLDYRIVHDSVFLRKYYVDFKFEPNTNYEFITDSLAFTSIYRQPSDSTGLRFATQKDDYYGAVRLTLENVRTPLIIQLWKGETDLVQEKYTDKNGVVVFDFLNPGVYRLKVIFDKNGNRKWDTGNFEKKLQPEKTAFYPTDFTIRSNWTIEETWKLE